MMKSGTIFLSLSDPLYNAVVLASRYVSVQIKSYGEFHPYPIDCSNHNCALHVTMAADLNFIANQYARD